MMTEYLERIKKLYEEEKSLPEPPSYVEILEEIIKSLEKTEN